MDTETTETGASTETGAEATEQQEETVSLSKSEFEKLNQTLGSLKRELKGYKNPPKEPEAHSQAKQPEDNGLLQKTFLRAANITAPADVEFALDKASKWKMDIDVLVDDEDFQIALAKHQTRNANELASSNIRGGGGQSQAKNTAEYWIAKGAPPSAADVPNRKTRATIARAMVAAQKSSKTFYND